MWFYYFPKGFISMQLLYIYNHYNNIYNYIYNIIIYIWSKCMLCTVLCSIINQLCSSTLMNFLAFFIFPLLFIYMHIYPLRHNTYHISAYEPQWVASGMCIRMNDDLLLTHTMYPRRTAHSYCTHFHLVTFPGCKIRIYKNW